MFLTSVRTWETESQSTILGLQCQCVCQLTLKMKAATKKKKIYYGPITVINNRPKKESLFVRQNQISSNLDRVKIS